MSSKERIQGVIRRLGLEGGLWALVSDDGTTIELIEPPEDLCRDGVRAEVEGVSSTADVTVGMVGRALEVRSFRFL